MPSLYVIHGRDQGKRFELADAKATIGRVAGNTIQLRDTEVSREHAVLRLQGNEYVVEDLGSSNGTFVNGKRIGESDLVTGDQVQVGRTLLLYTGVVSGELDDVSRHVHVVTAPSGGDDDESRIVHSLSHVEGSRLLAQSASEDDSPWLARARSNLQIMYGTALAVSHTLNIDQLLARILEMVFEWIDADRGCIMLKDPESGKLRPKAQRQRRMGEQSERIAISQTILDYVVEHSEGVLTSNAREDERWDPAQSIVKLGIREAMCVPLQGRYDIVGVIYVDTAVGTQEQVTTSTQLKKFQQEHLKLMIAIAHQAALAIEDTFHYKALVQAERLAAVGQTIASLSHHIKNILQGIRGGSYLIELGLQEGNKHLPASDDQVDSSAKPLEMIAKGWDIVEKNQQRISSLVLDMLSYSKDREPMLEPADIDELVGDVVRMLENRARDVAVALEFATQPNLPEFLCDADSLHRAILNVVTNALDACEGHESARVDVIVDWNKQRNVVTIRVQDNGPGIAAEDVESIFKAFVSTKGGKGTGLGLAVSKKIMQEHDGDIEVQSTIGEGSTFTLRLPAVQPPASESTAATSSGEV